MAGRTPTQRYQQAPPRAGKYVSFLEKDGVVNLVPAMELTPAALSAAGRLFLIRDSATIGEGETRSYGFECENAGIDGATFGILSLSFAAEGGSWSVTPTIGASIAGEEKLKIFPTRVGVPEPEDFEAFVNPTIDGGEANPAINIYSAAVQPRQVGVTGRADVPILFFPNSHSTASVVLEVENRGNQSREFTIEVLVIRACPRQEIE